MIPQCKYEGCTKIAKRRSRANTGKKRGFRSYCNKHERYKYETKYQYRLLKGDKCDSCGFIPEHECQLDVDHIDGDKSNAKKSNLQTLCANCHRLKTHTKNEYLSGRQQKVGAGVSFEL